MQRFLNISLIVVVVLVGFSLGRMTGNGLLPAIEDGPKEYPLPPPPPQPSAATEKMDDVAERKLILETPAEGASINGQLIVSGRAESATISGVTITVLDEDQTTVLQATAALRAGDGFARFSEPLAITTQATRLVLIVTGRDGTGAIVEQVERHLVSGKGDMLEVSVHFQNAKKDPSADVCSTTYALPRPLPSDTNAYRAAIEALLVGPTAEELKAGYSTSVPAKVILKDIGADANGVVTANFDGTLDRRVAGSCRVGAIRAQIERTLLQFPEVRGVIIEVEGDSDEALQP